MKKLLLSIVVFIFIGSTYNFVYSQNHTLVFDGVDDYVNGTHSGELNFTNTFSFSCWVYLTSITGDRQFIFENAQSNGANAQYIFGISDIGKIYFYGSSLPNPQGVYLGETTLILNVWSYISVTYDNQSLTIYLNGELDTTYTSSGSMYQYGHTNYIMGCYLYNNTQNFSGRLDDLSVWNIALDQPQIQTYMCNPPLSTTTGLVGMWWFNEGSGNIAVDSSQYQNDGIINGPIWNSGVTHCYSITTSANPTNGGSTTGDGDYLSGTQVTVIATPNTGWIFQDWTENGNVVSTDSSYTFTVSSDRDLVANFESITYTITTISNPTNGGTTSGGGNYSYGTIITLTASPNSGFYFINWTENGNVVSTSPSFQYTVTGNSTLVANFNQQEPYTITTSSNPVQGGITSGGGNYLPGSQCTVIATPNLGYLFYSWTEYGNQVSTNPIYTFTVTGNRTLVANFYLEVGIDEINPIFNIFPNPTSGIVHIQSSEPIERLLIYNSFGVLVKNTESNQNDVIIDLKLNSKGVYFIKITVGSKVFSRKVVLLY